jgi:hypothetical protein
LLKEENPFAFYPPREESCAPSTRDTHSPSSLGLPTVLYLGGLGRSGSTLFERMLDQLPGMTAVGELVHLPERALRENERCGCGSPFDQCSFWQQVGDLAFDGWQGIDSEHVVQLRQLVDRTRHIPLLNRTALPDSFGAALYPFLDFMAGVYSGVASASGASVIVDSSKHASLAFCLRRMAELDLRVVHLVRDSRAVAYSWSRVVERPDSAAPSFMTRYSPFTAASLWASQNLAFHGLEARGVPTLRLRYEDIVANPREALATVAQFAGLDPESARSATWLRDDDSESWASLAPSHTVSGNPVRFQTGEIAIRPDDRWRTEMARGPRRIVTALTLPLLASYKYPWATP